MSKNISKVNLFKDNDDKRKIFRAFKGVFCKYFSKDRLEKFGDGYLIELTGYKQGKSSASSTKYRGHLFQDRFKRSIIVDMDSYLGYIHVNLLSTEEYLNKLVGV